MAVAGEYGFRVELDSKDRKFAVLKNFLEIS